MRGSTEPTLPARRGGLLTFRASDKYRVGFDFNSHNEELVPVKSLTVTRCDAAHSLCQP